MFVRTRKIMMNRCLIAQAVAAGTASVSTTVVVPNCLHVLCPEGNC